MSVLTLVIVSLGAAALVLALRSRSTLAWALALVGLAAVAVVAIGLTPGTVGAGTSTLQTTGSDRSLLAAVGVGALLLGFVGAASSAPPTVAAGLSVGMAGVALAIATDDPLVGFWALTAAGLAVLGVASLDRARASAWASRALALRLTGGAGVVAVAGVSFAAPPLASPAHDPGILGLAYLGVAAAVAARLAAVPLHRWA
ncbi:MAG TPA: hypothetical protein VEY67_11170, partial [Candidatus Dormibacteraeota bacterium]|nr:hypothetical protein [Candidatus Dormibacteraeota bacterium]